MYKKSISLQIVLIFTAHLVLNACSSLPFKGLMGSHAQEKGKAVPAALKQSHETGIALLKKKDYEAARKHFSELVKAFPNYSGPNANLALAYLGLKKFEEANKAIEAALKARQENFKALTIKGQILRHLGEFKAAEAAYKKSLAINDRYPNTILNLGILYDIYMGEPEKALASYKSYLDLPDKADSPVKNWVVDLERRINKGS